MLCVMIVEGPGTPGTNVVGRPGNVLVVEARLIWLESVRMQGNSTSNNSKLYQLHPRGRLCQHHRQEGKISCKVKEEVHRIEGRYCRSKLFISGAEVVEVG